VKVIEPITITLDGPPTPKARPRFGRGRTYTPQSTERFERHFGWAAKAAMVGRGLLYGPVAVTATFEVFGSPTSKRSGDLDNLCKAALDSLREIVFHDDSQVVELNARKVCSATPKTTLTIVDLTKRSENDEDDRKTQTS
jgi:Holliday junction resolvase RusA-like endonuclease